MLGAPSFARLHREKGGIPQAPLALLPAPRPSRSLSLFVRGEREMALPASGCVLLRRGALVVQGEEPGEDFVAGEVGRPAVGGEDGLIEGAVSVGQPLGALIVEIGQSAFHSLTA